MSWQKSLLNRSLKLIEKPHLTKASPEKLRSALEFKSRVLFSMPKGTTKDWEAVGQSRALWVRSETADRDSVLLYFHGGGYVFGSPRTHSAMLARLSQLCGIQACLPRYRLAPENPFPAAFEDGFAAYEALLAKGIPASRIIIGGDSAGGGLALAVLGEILRQNMQAPAGVFAFSPLTDMTYASPSIQQNAASDVVLPASRVTEMVEIYLDEADPKDPRASPLYADFTGACPVWVCVGTTEILRDDTINMVERLKSQGVDVTSVVEENLPHVWPIFYKFLPEARKTLGDVGSWITRTLSGANGS